MSREQYAKAIEQEIHRLNARIDFKILRGEQYKQESRRHKLLLQKMRAQQHKGLFGRFLLKII